MTKKELEKENLELKEEALSFKEAFIKLQLHVDEMSFFNEKLVYMYKLLVNMNFSSEEKIEIANKFDEVNNSNEAQALYKSLMEKYNN